MKLSKNLHKDVKPFMKSLIEILKANDSMDDLDTLSLTMLANNYSIYLKTSEELGDEYTIINAQGNTVSNPLVKIMNDAQNQCQKLMTKFPLSPLDRKRLRSEMVAKDTDELDELAQFLK